MEKLKSFIPSIYNKTQSTITSAINSVTISESQEIISNNNTENELLELLKSKTEIDEVTALKYLIGFILLNKDIQKFAVKVLELYPKNRIYIKKLGLYIIEHLSLKQTYEIVLLHNSIVKGFSMPDILNRYLSVYVIVFLAKTSIKDECFKLIKEYFNDSNPIIRRLCMISLSYFVRENNIDIDADILHLVQNSLKDPHPLVFSSAIYFFSEFSNEHFEELIASKFLYIVDNLEKVDHYYFERCLHQLNNFTVKYLRSDNNKQHLLKYVKTLYNIVKNSNDHLKNFSILNSLLQFTEILSERKLNNISLYLLRTLINFEKSDALNTLILIQKFIKKSEIAKKNFSQQLDYFSVRMFEPEYLQLKKFEIIIELVNEENIKEVIEDFKLIMTYPSNELRLVVVQSLYYISKKNKNLATICIEKIIDFLRFKDDNLSSQIIIILRKLIFEIKEHTKYVLAYSLKHFTNNISSNLAKANIIWMVSQYIELIPTVSAEFYRGLVLKINEQSDEVKTQSISFGLKLFQLSDKLHQESISLKIKELVKFHFEKMFFDANNYIREKARMAKFVVNSVFIENKDVEFLGKMIEEKLVNESFSKEESQTLNDHCYEFSYCNLIRTKEFKKKYFVYYENEVFINEDILLDEVIKTSVKPAVVVKKDAFEQVEGKKIEGSITTYENINHNINEKRDKIKNEFLSFLENVTEEYTCEIEPEN